MDFKSGTIYVKTMKIWEEFSLIIILFTKTKILASKISLTDLELEGIILLKLLIREYLEKKLETKNLKILKYLTVLCN